MRRIRFGLAVAAGFAISISQASAQSATAESDISVSGKRVSSAELEDSEPRASFSKQEIMAVVTTGKPECKHGIVEATYEPDAGFSLGSDRLDEPALIRRVIAMKESSQASCLRIRSKAYDKASFVRLGDALVMPHGVSLMWPTPDEAR